MLTYMKLLKIEFDRMKLYEIKSLKIIINAIKNNWNNRGLIKLFHSQIKNPKPRIVQT
jgi:hypothetical protein